MAVDGSSSSSASTTKPADATGFSLSNKILGTLDPCVVKTKQWMEDYAHLWQAAEEQEQQGILSLAQGVVYWNPPPSCRQALRDAVLQQMGDDSDDNRNDNDPLALHSYSPARGLPELIEALETKIRIEHGMAHHDVTVTVGANQAYTNIVLTLLGDDNNNDNNVHNNKAVVFAPYYFNHVMAIQMCASPEAVVVGPTDMTTGVPDIDWLRKTLNNDNNKDNIRLVTLVNPGNPTGVALSREELQEIVDLCREHGVWVVLDCTYEHFFHATISTSSASTIAAVAGESTTTNTKRKYDTNPLPTFPDDPHVIHVFSFSKGYALAGYRCGYLVTHKQDASGGKFLNQMLKVQDTIPIGPPRLSQHVALGALKQGGEAKETITTKSSSSQPRCLYSPGSKEWVYDKYDTLDASRQLILEALSSLPQQIGGSGSMYVMGKLPEDLSCLSLQEGEEEEYNANDSDNKEDETNEPIDVVFCRRLMKDYGIAIIPGSFCGKPGWIRVCYANLPPDRTKIAAERLRKGIEELTKRCDAM